MSKRWQMREATRIVEVGGYVARLLLAVTVGLALLGFFPAKAQAEADTDPVDLVLGGEGAVSWNIVNIAPADSGTKTVELHNAGNKAGFVTIWVSDVISSEGINPESETGDTAEPGEINDYLLLDLSADGLTSGLSLPVVFNNLPQSVSAPGYIELIPLKAGDTVSLQWQWELPAQTGNDVQGDGISFTINYLLQEFSLTDVSEVVSDEGVFTEEVTVESEGGKAKLTIQEGTIGLTEEGKPLSELWIIETDKEPPAPPANAKLVGSTLDLGPDDATFDPPITLTSAYDPAAIPERASEGDLVIATWDEDAGEWVALEGGTVDTLSNTVSAPVSHFSRYTIIAPVPPPPPPPLPFFPSPESVDEEKKPLPPVSEEDGRRVTATLLEVDMLGQEATIEIGADGTLSEPLTIIDPSGNFVIDIDSGTKVTGSGNVALSRIELRITDESIVVPEDIVVLSPIYKLTGYTRNMEVTRIDFDPSARLTISYDPENLPENTFPPFIAVYTEEQGLVRLQPPPDATIEIGKAKAKISHASLFAVMAQLAPPPPPLPAKFEVSNLTVNPRQAQLGQSVIISIEIANEGDTAGSFELHLIIDGIVRMVKEITLAGKSSETLTFEVSNLAAGKHQVKIAGLTERFRIARVTTLIVESGVNWLVLDVSVGAALAMGALVLYLVTRRSRQAQFK